MKWQAKDNVEGMKNLKKIWEDGAVQVEMVTRLIVVTLC